MDIGKIKALATGARVQLMDGVRASLERVLAPDSPESIYERGRVNELRNEAKDKEALIERVAYTWFNRLCALRLMDSRGYTPVPVVTPRAGETMPAILADARRGVFCAEFPLKPNDKQRVIELVSGNTESVNPLGEAYVILLVSACDYYAKLIPMLFGSDIRNTNAIRLLAPTGLLSEKSVLQRILEGMDDNNCNKVEVMGWLYQYYIEERRADINAAFKARGKDKVLAGPKEIAPATQIFTPNWIVRYMVENSLGRLWIENFPDSELKQHMPYFTTTAQENDVTLRIDSPEDIAFLDPAMGSGHILVYAFDLLYEMYVEEGYRPTEIPALILQKNLTGFEIDDRAAEIAAFALIIKAREKDVDFFNHVVQPDITVFQAIQLEESELIDVGILSAHEKLLKAMRHLDEVGSLYKPDLSDAILLESALSNLSQQVGLFAGQALSNIETATAYVNQLTRNFDIVVANPPYLGNGNMNPWLSDWLKENYPDEKGDLCTCFITREMDFSRQNGLVATITSQSWLTLSSYHRLRQRIIDNSQILTLIDTRGSANHADIFDANAGFVLRKTPPSKPCIGTYYQLNQAINFKEEALLEGIRCADCAYRYNADQSLYECIPDSPIAYWATDNVRRLYLDNPPLKTLATPKHGMSTGSNEICLKLWFEVSFETISLTSTDYQSFDNSGMTYIPYNKGGEYRLWFGNDDYVLAYSVPRREQMKKLSGFRACNLDSFFKPSLNWSDVSSGDFGARMSSSGYGFDGRGASMFGDDSNLKYLAGFLNSATARHLLRALNQTITFNIANIENLPLIVSEEHKPRIVRLVEECVVAAQDDWNSFEKSWYFLKHPIFEQQERLGGNAKISELMMALKESWQTRFTQLKENEEELNRLFAGIYHMEREVSTVVPEDKLTIQRVNEKREIRSLISYAIGCMFGRYSLDMDGLILADQGSTVEDYLAKIPSPSFMPDEDGILPITEEEWFEDDIVTEFWLWLKIAFGDEHFDENLTYIENVLGCKLREYFIKGAKSAYYEDHCKLCSVGNSGKRPIYWMFSSPKSSFNCLVYLHRYDDRTISKILTDYVRELRRKLEIQARSLEASDVARDRTRADKYHNMIDELNDWERDVLYPMAQRHIKIDLDDGVRHNYKLFPGALRKVTGLT